MSGELNPPPPIGGHLEHRRPVWLALSDLFLDTDITLHYDAIARALAASPYPVAQLAIILRDEVYPVCYPNLLSVAGVWDGFDAEWLEHEILSLGVAKRTLARTLGQCTVSVNEDWQAVRQRVESLRQATTDRPATQ